MKRMIAVCAIALLSTGCLGTNGLNRTVKEWNVEVVENRYAREGVFLVLTVVWVYRICTVLDLFIFNSWEFWTGTNPINGKKALVDVPAAEIEKMGFKDLEGAKVELVSENAAKLHLAFANGDRMGFDVLRSEDSYTVSYMGRVFFTGQVEPLHAAAEVAP